MTVNDDTDVIAGGVREAFFSNEYYKLEWGKRIGFAKVATEAQVVRFVIYSSNVFSSVLGLKCVRNLPNTTHSDMFHLLSDDLPIFDELCRRSLMFICKCYFPQF